MRDGAWSELTSQVLPDATTASILATICMRATLREAGRDAG